MMKKGSVLIVGNGAIGVHENKQFFINDHTGKFLLQIKKEQNPTFVQNISKYNQNNDLQNFDLSANGIDFKCLKNNKNIIEIFRLIILLMKNEFVYIFFPGTLSRIAGLFCILFKKKYGLYVRGQFFNESILDGWILKKAKICLTVSPSFLDLLKNYSENIALIKPMISITKDDLVGSRTFNRPNCWNLLFVGRVEYRKGIEELLEIACFLREKKIHFQLNIVGGGAQFAQMSEKIHKLGLDDYINLLGQISGKQRLMEIYASADAFIFASHDEGFPRVLYEAMASALPIFTTFVGGIPGRMKNGINCVEIPVKNGQAAGRIIADTLDKPRVLANVGTAGQKTLSEVLSGNFLSHEDLLCKYMSGFFK
jgi:glycosyltransferase involved in cell wall biosynthesis